MCIRDSPNGATIMCGGFLACGQARAIVKELVALGTKDLTLIANDMGRAVGPKLSLIHI